MPVNGAPHEAGDGFTGKKHAITALRPVEKPELSFATAISYYYSVRCRRIFRLRIRGGLRSSVGPG